MFAPSARRGAACITAFAAATSLVGCSASTHHPSSTSSTAPAAVTRWWSNSAVTVGSAVDPAHPDAAATQLKPSRQDYCGMLKQTLDSRRSLLPSGSGASPRVEVATEAFVAEIAKVAPDPVAGSWQRLGPAILALIKPGGHPPNASGGVSAQNLQAAEAINEDAKKACGLDLSSVATG